MSKLDVKVREKMIETIIGETHDGLAHLVNAAAQYNLAAFAQKMEDEQNRADFVGLMVDAAICLIPMGSVLMGFLKIVSKVTPSEIMTVAVLKKVIAFAKSPITTDVAKEITKYVVKTNEPAVSEAVDKVMISKVESQVITNALLKLFDSQISNLREFLSGADADYDKVPDWLLSRLYGRWHPDANTLDYYTDLLGKCMETIKNIQENLGVHSRQEPNKSITAETRIFFDCLDAGELESNGFPTYVEVVPYIVCKSDIKNYPLGGKGNSWNTKKVTWTPVPPGLQYLVATIACTAGSVWNNPLQPIEVDLRYSPIPGLQELHTKRVFDAGSSLILRQNPNGRFGTNSFLGMHYFGSVRFDLAPTAEWGGL